MEPSATRTTCHRTCRRDFKRALKFEDAPAVLDCPAPLRRFGDSGGGYKYPDLLILRASCKDFSLRDMASAGARAYKGVWGQCPQRGPEAEPLVRGQRGEAH